MDTLVDYIFGVVPQELKDVLDLGLVGQPPQPDAVPPGAGSDQLLGYHSHGSGLVRRVRTVGHGEIGDEGARARGHGAHQAGAGAGLAGAGVLRGPVEHLLHLGRGGPEELDVSGADYLFVLEQRLLPLALLLEQHEGVPSGPAVGFLDKKNSTFLVQHITGLLAIVKEFNLKVV